MNAIDERTKSPWMSVPVAPDASVLSADLQCDYCGVGSGIAGLSCAYELATEDNSWWCSIEAPQAE